MKKLFGLLLFVIVLFSGCVQEEKFPLINLDSIEQYADKNVTVEGCLKFGCSLKGYKTREGCWAYICDEGNCINNLIFDEKQVYYTLYDDYIDELLHSKECIKIKVRGTVIGPPKWSDCEPPCAFEYRIEVSYLEVGDYVEEITVTTTTPFFKACKNFNITVTDVKEIEEEGIFNTVVINITAKYTGDRKESFGHGGVRNYSFEMRDDGGNIFQYSSRSWFRRRCAYGELREGPKEFEIRTVMPGDVRSGCLEFEILDIYTPVELIFLDTTVNGYDMCYIKL